MFLRLFSVTWNVLAEMRTHTLAHPASWTRVREAGSVYRVTALGKPSPPTGAGISASISGPPFTPGVLLGPRGIQPGRAPRGAAPWASLPGCWRSPRYRPHRKHKPPVRREVTGFGDGPGGVVREGELQPGGRSCDHGVPAKACPWLAQLVKSRELRLSWIQLPCLWQLSSLGVSIPRVEWHGLCRVVRARGDGMTS